MHRFHQLGLHMADVFISYSQQTPEFTTALAKQLQDRRLDVWWDSDLTIGQRFNDVIRQQLEDADAVVVIWTPESVRSQYVLMEAGIAYAWDKLITVRAPNLPVTDLPGPFAGLQTGLVTDIEGVLKALSEKDVRPRSSTRGKKLTRDEMFSLLSVVDPGLPAKLDAWLRQCQTAGFRIVLNRSLMLKAAVPGLGDVNFGTLWPDGKLQTNIISDTAARAGDPTIATAYLDGVAALVEGANVRRDGNPWNWRVEVYGELPRISQLLARGDEWLSLMIETRRRFLERAI
jgi:hypothetical protein